MLKYTNKDKNTLNTFLNIHESTNNNKSYSPLNPKYLPTRPPNIIIPKR